MLGFRADARVASKFLVTTDSLPQLTTGFSIAKMVNGAYLTGTKMQFTWSQYAYRCTCLTDYISSLLLRLHTTNISFSILFIDMKMIIMIILLFSRKLSIIPLCQEKQTQVPQPGIWDVFRGAVLHVLIWEPGSALLLCLPTCPR